MADPKISEFTALPGVSVDVDADVLAIVDASAGIAGTKKISVRELIANTPAFLPSGTGAPRTVESKLRETVSVTDFYANGVSGVAVVGDGITDCTGGFAAAALTGKNLYIPGVADSTTQFYKLTNEITLNSNQRVYGDGYASIVKQTTTKKSVFKATSKNYVQVVDVHLYAPGDLTSIGDGSCVHFSGCTQALVSGCYLTNPGTSCVFLYDSTECTISGNHCITLGSYSPSNQEVDIYLYGSSSRNVVIGNIHKTGGSTAIAVLTDNTGTATGNDNVIEGNVIDTYSRYGVMCYRFHANDVVLRNKIIGNSIRNITGSSSDDGGTTKEFGAGVYIQGAEYSVVSDNTIDTVNTQTNSDILAPGGIGATNVTNVTITGNEIRNCTREGITVRDPSATGAAVGHAVISGNNLQSITRTAIQVVERGKVSITGNSINTAARGVYVANTVTKRETVAITGNTVRITTSNGIETAFAAGVTITGNVLREVAVNGISLGNTDRATVVGNICVNGTAVSGSTGINITSTCGDGLVLSGNHCTDNEYGIIAGSKVRTDLANHCAGNSNQFAGDYAPFVTSAPAAGTWVVGDFVWHLTPASGGNMGFVCTTGGTPGTWKNWGAIA